MPPSFGDPAYWEQRFHDEPTPYDWLIPASQLCDLVNGQIRASASPSPSILHIGCGSSDLPFELRKTVSSPAQVHNVDYAQAAIDLGVMKEGKPDTATGAPTIQQMRWSRLDLLSAQSIHDLRAEMTGKEERAYSLVIDKSTSDSICCSDDVSIPLPYTIASGAADQPRRASIHPLTLLAVHLAAITTPGVGRWLAISYNDDRFPFLSFNPRTRNTALLSEEVVAKGFPDPRELWRLEEKYPLEGPPAKTLSGDVVHRPDLTNWVYVMVRTEAAVM